MHPLDGAKHSGCQIDPPTTDSGGQIIIRLKRRSWFVWNQSLVISRRHYQDKVRPVESPGNSPSSSHFIGKTSTTRRQHVCMNLKMDLINQVHSVQAVTLDNRMNFYRPITCAYQILQTHIRECVS